MPRLAARESPSRVFLSLLCRRETLHIAYRISGRGVRGDRVVARGLVTIMLGKVKFLRIFK